MIIDPNEYITGIPLIDNQHKQYIVLVTKFITTYNKGDMDKATLINYVNEIVAYALEHFEAEEYLMRSSKYLLYEQHLAKHNIFHDKMDEFLAELDVKEININNYVTKLSEWLVGWFKIQVLDDDVKLAMFLQGKNMAKS